MKQVHIEHRFHIKVISQGFERGKLEFDSFHYPNATLQLETTTKNSGASAPGMFQNLMENVFSSFSYEDALVYLDDIFVSGKMFEEKLWRLKQKHERLEKSSLWIKRSKSLIFAKNSFFGEKCLRGKTGVASRERDSRY